MFESECVCVRVCKGAAKKNSMNEEKGSDGKKQGGGGVRGPAVAVLHSPTGYLLHATKKQLEVIKTEAN